jgi:hypothetical protein
MCRKIIIAPSTAGDAPKPPIDDAKKHVLPRQDLLKIKNNAGESMLDKLEETAAQYGLT